jgi:hypothetical protein
VELENEPRTFLFERSRVLDNDLKDPFTSEAYFRLRAVMSCYELGFAGP